MVEKHDVLVVGAGTAGCTAARAAAEKGLDVLLLELKPEERIGEKVCADAIGKHHFDRLGMAYPSGEELKTRVRGVRVYSPSKAVSYFVPGEGFILNRKAFGQRLLREALNAGAELRDRVKVLNPIVKDGFVVGVEARDLRTGSKLAFYAEVVVDASGFFPAVRSKLPPEAHMPERLDPRDYCVGYREIRELATEPEEPDTCLIFLSNELAPGGYAWIFPAGGNRVNVGLGVQASRGRINPRELLYEKVLKWSIFKGSRVLEAGAWFIPTRRPLDTMVWNGLIVVGDAACQANPLHGGGIGQTLLGGSLAGEVASDALEEGDVSASSLWPYNVEFMRLMGARNAELDVFRIFLQTLSDDEIDYGMRKRLISEKELAMVSEGKPLSLGIVEKLARGLKALDRPGFLRRLSRVLGLMKAVREHYAAYPREPEGLGAWQKKTEELFATTWQL